MMSLHALLSEVSHSNEARAPNADATSWLSAVARCGAYSVTARAFGIRAVTLRVLSHFSSIRRFLPTLTAMFS